MEATIKEDPNAWRAAELDPVTQVISSRPHISWRAIFAGAFVAVLVDMLLATLGMAVGAIGLEHVLRQGGGQGLTIGAGIWFIVSAIIALAVGSYVGARASGLVPSRIGGIEGLVVSALLFVAMFAGLGSGLRALGSETGALLGSAGRGVTNLAENDQVQSVVQGALGELDLRSSPTQVAQGVAGRLLRGDEQGAANYLASQAGISPSDANERLQDVKADLGNAATGAARTFARATQLAGWTLFLTILLGSAAGLGGGALGARRNFQQPMSKRDWRLAAASRPQWLNRRPEAPRESHSPS